MDRGTLAVLYGLGGGGVEVDALWCLGCMV